MSYEIGAILGAAVASLVAFVALREYAAAQKWKRAEFAVSQIRLLADDTTLAFCCRAIDWGVGPLVVPSKYQQIVPTPTIVHDWALMRLALRPHLDPLWRDAEKGPQVLLYRYAFDEFCGYLDAIALYRELGIIRPKDLSAVEDYIAQMHEPRYARDADGRPDKAFFGEFVTTFYAERVAPWMAEIAQRRDSRQTRSATVAKIALSQDQSRT